MGGVGGVGVAVAAPFAHEQRLQRLAEVLTYSLFGVFLHFAVDCGVDAQSVGVDVVVATVALVIFVTPSV